MDTSLIISLLLLVAAILQLVFGGIVFFINRMKLEGVWYSIHLISLGLWTFGMFFYYWFPVELEESILFWARFLYCFGVCSAISFFLFTYSFVKGRTVVWQMILFLAWATALGYSIFNGDGIVSGISLDLSNRVVLHGDLYFLFFTTLFAFYLSGFYVLIKKYTHTPVGILQKQIKYILISTIPVVGVASVFNMILPAFWGNFSYAWLSPLILLFEAFFIYYSIYRYRFLDVKLTIFRILKIVFSFISSLFITYGFAKGLVYFIGADQLLFLRESVFIGMGILSYLKIHKFLNSAFVEKIFGIPSSEYFKRSVLLMQEQYIFNDSVLKFEETLNKVFCEKLGIDFVEIVVLNAEKKVKYKAIISYFSNEDEFLIRSEIPYIEKNKNKKLDIKIDEIEGEVFILLKNAYHGYIGIFVLGKKAKGEIYSKEEVRVLRQASHYLTSSLMGILYNKDLKDEVKLKTKQLAEKNKKLKKSYEKLRVFDEAKDNFLAIASHELRTPMTVIKGYTDFLLSDSFGPLNKKQKDFTHYIQESTNDLLMLVNDMLDLSKIESGEMEFQYEKIEMKKCIIFFEQSFAMECLNRDIRFEIVVGENIPKYIIWDSQKIRLVMTNLIGNSMKFTPAGGSIVVSIFHVKGALEIEIHDTGIGIEKKYLENIFDKFFQAKNHLKKEYKGTGLGLSIVKKIIEKMDGSVSVKSKLGKGTTFTIKLPIKSEV